MPSFNRNIITQADVEKYRSAEKPEALPKTLDTNPPAGLTRTFGLTGAAGVPNGAAGSPNGGGQQTATAPGGVTVLTEDDYLTKLVKYVPLEVLGAYLFIQGVVTSNVTKKHDLAIWLGVLLIGFLVITVIYDRMVLNVVRKAQLAISVVGLAVYIFSVGGWFATTTWYQQWYATIALPLFGLLVAIMRLGPLPAAGPTTDQGNQAPKQGIRRLVGGAGKAKAPATKKT